MSTAPTRSKVYTSVLGHVANGLAVDLRSLEPMADHDGARLATHGDAGVLAALLHDFNVEFDSPSPGPATIERRLGQLLGTESTFAVLAGDPAHALALVTLRPNVWYSGPVALLDEMYVTPEHRADGIGTDVLQLGLAHARHLGAELMEINVDDSDVDNKRFYRRHGFFDVDPDNGETATYFAQPLG